MNRLIGWARHLPTPEPRASAYAPIRPDRSHRQPLELRPLVSAEGKGLVVRNGRLRVWLIGDSHDQVPVTFGVRPNVGELDASARYGIDDRARAFFD